MGKALLSLFGSFTILTIDLRKPFKRKTVVSMMEARENSSPRSSSCLMGQMLIVPQRGARIKSNHHLLREYCGPKMCLSPSVTGDYAPHKKLERDVHSLSGNQEMARECCLWNMSWCKSPRRWYNISPPKNTSAQSLLPGELPGAAGSHCIRESQGLCQLTGLYPAPIPTPWFASY